MYWSGNRLDAAPAEGVSVRDLINATGRSRTWVYSRLQHYSNTGRVTQVGRGRWRRQPET